MSELDSSREGEQERWGAGKERGRRDMEVLTPDPKVWGRKGRAGRERPAFRRSPRRAAARAAVGGGAGGHSTWMPGPEGQLQALPTLPGSGPGGRPPQPRGPGRSYDGGAAAVRRGSQVSLDAPVRQGHVLPGGGGEGAGGALPWLTGLTPWMPVADCPLGTGPGRRASCSCRRGQLLPGPCPPGAGLGLLSPHSQRRRPRLPGARVRSWAAGSRQAAQRCQPCPSGSGEGGAQAGTTRVRQTPTGAGSGRHWLRLGFRLPALARGLGSSSTFRPTALPAALPLPRLWFPQCLARASHLQEALGNYIWTNCPGSLSSCPSWTRRPYSCSFGGSG